MSRPSQDASSRNELTDSSGTSEESESEEGGDAGSGSVVAPAIRDN